MPRLQALFTYLVLHGDAPQPRAHLAFLLWPDSAESQARTNLRTLLHRVRQVLPNAERFVQANGRMVQWCADAPWTLDVAEFEQALAQANQAEQQRDKQQLRLCFQRAVDLYRGDLLPNCYDDWLLVERERLQQQFGAALERLVLLLEEDHDYSAAVVFAQRLLMRKAWHCCEDSAIQVRAPTRCIILGRSPRAKPITPAHERISRRAWRCFAR